MRSKGSGTEPTLTVLKKVTALSPSQEADVLIASEKGPSTAFISVLGKTPPLDLSDLARKPVLTLAETALLLRVSKSTVRGLIVAGDVIGSRIGHQWRIPSGQFANLIPSAAQAYPISPLPLAVGQ